MTPKSKSKIDFSARIDICMPSSTIQTTIFLYSKAPKVYDRPGSIP